MESGINGIVYITDYDTVINQNKKHIFENLRNNFKNDSRVLICETMPSIEFWFLLHFINTTRSFKNANEVFRLLKKYMPDYEKRKVWFEKPQWVKFLCKENKIEIAHKRAKIIFHKKDNQSIDSHYPYTKIFMAIDKFKEWKNIKQ